MWKTLVVALNSAYIYKKRREEVKRRDKRKKEKKNTSKKERKIGNQNKFWGEGEINFDRIVVNF